MQSFRPQLEELTQFFAPDGSSKQLRNNRDLQEVYDRKIYQSDYSLALKPSNISLFIASLAILFAHNLNASR